MPPMHPIHPIRQCAPVRMHGCSVQCRSFRNSRANTAARVLPYSQVCSCTQPRESEQCAGGALQRLGLTFRLSPTPRTLTGVRETDRHTLLHSGATDCMLACDLDLEPVLPRNNNIPFQSLSQLYRRCIRRRPPQNHQENEGRCGVTVETRVAERSRAARPDTLQHGIGWDRDIIELRTARCGPVPKAGPMLGAGPHQSHCRPRVT